MVLLLITTSKSLQYSVISSLNSEVNKSLPSLPHHSEFNPNKNYLHVYDIQICRAGIEHILSTIDTIKAVGPDLVNLRILKEASKF
jgi:hypothetical protein